MIGLYVDGGDIIIILLAVKHKIGTLVKAHVGVGEEASHVIRQCCIARRIIKKGFIPVVAQPSRQIRTGNDFRYVESVLLPLPVRHRIEKAPRSVRTGTAFHERYVMARSDTNDGK